MASHTSPQWLRIFSTTLAQKYKIWRLKLPKWIKEVLNTDMVAFSGVSESMEDFFTKSQSWKKVRQISKSRRRTCAEACHSPFKGYVWGGMQQNNGTWTGRCFFCVSPVALVWRFTLTSRLPSLACKKREKNNTCCARYWLVENRSKKLDFLATKIGHQKNVKGAMQSYFLVHFKRLIWSSFHINSVPKTMVQFCYVRLDLGTETVSCRGLFLLMARMNMYWRLKKMGQCSLIKWYFVHTSHLTLQEHFLIG